MASKVLTVTVPEELYARIEEQREEGHYSRSEFVREALRRYLGISTVTASQEEVAAIAAGREAIAKGDFVPLDALTKK